MSVITLSTFYGSIGGGGNYGTWTASAGTAWGALGDGSDSTYVTYTGSGVAYPAIRIDMADITLPAGARIRGFRGNVRAATVTAPRTFQWRVHALNYPAGVTDWITTDVAYLTTVPTWYYGKWQTTVSYGNNLIPATINGLSIEVFGVTDANPVFYEIAIEVLYDNAPAVAISSPTGTVTATSSPAVAWTYADDLEPQQSFQVEVYSGSTIATSARIHTSGVVVSAAGTYQLPMTLADGTYTVRVQASQRWAYGGGVFWSPWMAQAFTILSLAYGAPELQARPNHGFANVVVQHNANLMSYLESSAGAGASEWDSRVNLTSLATTTAVAHSGSNAFAAVLSSTGECTAKRAAAYIPATAGVTYAARCYFKAAASACNVAVSISFYDQSRALIGTTVGDYILESTAIAWTPVTLSVFSPEGTTFVGVGLNWSGGVVGQTHYFDDVQLWMTDVAFSTPGIGRGSLLYGQHQTSENFSHVNFPLAEQNRLTTRNATMESVTDWTASAGSTVDVSTTQALIGPNSLRHTRTSTTGKTQASLPTVGYELVTPGEMYAMYASVRAGTTARTTRLSLVFYDSNVAPIATGSVGGTDSSAAWASFSTVTATGATVATTLDGGTAVVAPATAVYAALWTEVDAVVAGEYHYFDRMACYKLDTDTPVAVGWEQGRPVGVTAQAVCTVEYFEEDEVSPTWHTLASLEINPLSPTLTFQDWDITHRSIRRYRARTSRVYADTTIGSADSPEDSTTIEVDGVWLSRPTGVGYNFRFLAKGRTDSRDNKRTLTYFAGRQFPVSETSESRERTISVSLQLPSDHDRLAFDTFSKLPGQLIYRDNRGRRMRGIIDSPVVTDVEYGQEATFNFVVTGDQSIREQP